MYCFQLLVPKQLGYIQYPGNRLSIGEENIVYTREHSYNDVKSVKLYHIVDVDGKNDAEMLLHIR
jgi:hypothetical protein